MWLSRIPSWVCPSRSCKRRRPISSARVSEHPSGKDRRSSSHVLIAHSHAGIAHLVPLPTYPVFPSEATVEHHTRARVERLRLVEAANREIERVKHEKAREGFVKGGDKAKAKREARAQRKAEEAAAKAAAEQDGLEGLGEASGSEPRPKVEESSVESGEAAGSGPTSGASADVGAEVSAVKPESPGQAEGADDKPQPLSGLHFHTVPAHPVLPQPDIEPITSLPHPLFPFPSTPRDHALLATFTDLLDRALRVGLGPRFGGEYLVYPGDYLRYHAHFTSQVLVRDEPIRPTELVAWGRLGTGTKKAGLLCAWDDGKVGDEPVDTGDKGRVEYYSLEWANFG